MLLDIAKLEFVVILVKCIIVIINTLGHILLLFTALCYYCKFSPVVANELKVSHIHKKYLAFALKNKVDTTVVIYLLWLINRKSRTITGNTLLH